MSQRRTTEELDPASFDDFSEPASASSEFAEPSFFQVDLVGVRKALGLDRRDSREFGESEWRVTTGH